MAFIAQSTWARSGPRAECNKCHAINAMHPEATIVTELVNQEVVLLATKMPLVFA